MDFLNKIIWITGASSGIGEAIAVMLATEKPVLLLSSRKEKELQRVQQICISAGAECHIFPLDVSDTDSIEMAAKKVLDQFGHVDLLINSAGISQRSTVIETPVEVDRKIMEINYFGTIALTKAMLPAMIKHGGGHVVAVSSIVGKFGFPLRSSYSASKHALHGFFETLEAELKKENIRTTVVIPGRVKTNISVNAITRDGTAYGVMDEGQAKGISAEKCARVIIRGLKKNKKEILVGGRETLMVQIRRFLPSLYFKIASKLKAT
jgi:short-subunit dehydrogenase